MICLTKWVWQNVKKFRVGLSTDFKQKKNKGGNDMNYTVPMLSIVFMGISALSGIAIPVVLFVVLRKKYKADILPFFIG